VFAVIPQVCEGDWRSVGRQTYANLKADKCQLFRYALSAAPVDVALHGLTHQTVSAKGPPAEFLSGSAAEQEAKITAGVESLQNSLGCRPVVFVPPWNRYDQTTVEVLIKTGFRFLSAGRNLKRAAHPPLLCIGTTVNPEEFGAALQAAKRSRRAELAIIVELHEYDFAEVNPTRSSTTLEAFSTLVRELQADAEVRLVNFTQIEARADDWQQVVSFPMAPRWTRSRISRWIVRALIVSLAAFAICVAVLIR
jgi:predicted deacetylase